MGTVSHGLSTLLALDRASRDNSRVSHNIIIDIGDLWYGVQQLLRPQTTPAGSKLFRKLLRRKGISFHLQLRAAYPAHLPRAIYSNDAAYSFGVQPALIHAFPRRMYLRDVCYQMRRALLREIGMLSNYWFSLFDMIVVTILVQV